VYLFAVGLLTLLLLVLFWSRQRSGKTVAVWLFSALTGVLLGSVGSMALACLLGYQVLVVHGTPSIFPIVLDPKAGVGAPVAAGLEGADAGSGDMGAMGMGGSGMGGRGRGGERPPRPKRDLTRLVQKIDLLSGDVGITLSDQQGASLCLSLADAQGAETMSDEDAQATHDAILALLDDDQQARLEAVDLPRRRRGPGGSGGGPGGPGGGEPDPNANPFQDETIAQVVVRLHERFGHAPAADLKPAESAEKEEAPAAEKEPAESAEKEGAPAAEKEPAESAEKEGAPAAEKEPAVTAEKEGAPAAEKEPSESAEKEGAPAAEKEPAESAEKEAPSEETEAAETAETPAAEGQPAEAEKEEAASEE
jgi:hypothetical protein